MIKTYVLALAAALTIGGCGDEPEPEPAAPASTPESAAPSSSPAASVAPVKAPAVADGELVRRVMTIRDRVPNEQTTIHRLSDGTGEYMVQAACADQKPDKTLTYVVKVGKAQRELVRGEFPCDGSVRQDGISTLERGQVLIYLDGGPVESAYALIRPLGTQ
ncbi:hypothetical protein OWR29_23840 [Actinoplanes sp. Pm04-4]|uniref:Lipoprotein n=1 Tax=Paractinoplanes pyxinae TaxID=2997416 RepID=A0ABT4B3G4_9ACTN|nr:hypothetical protein [Actinoplanes pyxinae]MCY1141041.1 hypothetical protein [Actinoplanes pyxinae]